MFKFVKLVQNENMKLFRKTSTFIMMLLIVAFIAGAGAIFKMNVDDSAHRHWQADTEKEIAALHQQLDHAQGDQVNQIKENIAIKQYRLDHDIAPTTETSVWGFSQYMTNMTLFIAIFTIIAAGGMVSGEFGAGTIKLLLTRPVKRGTILLSKYVSTLFYSVILTVLSLVVSFIVGGLLFGFNGIGDPHLTYSQGAVHEHSMLGHIIAQYGFGYISIIIFATIAFMISTVFRNTALAIGLSVFAMMGSGLIIMFLSRYAWGKYVLFSNLDLTVYFDGGEPPYKGMTLGFSLAVLVIYYIVFVAITWFSFKKRDVAA
ncbi:ABC transporter permease [Camelliibacillus cellulosilyticus]|uniref:ABC transporter permease n=1 Tax=Camelliibacillus cellulosilyticus TaxID=2174486 RepID=A0ABV9GFQ1_9BACL